MRIPEGWLSGPRASLSAAEALCLLTVWQIALRRGEAVWKREKPEDVIVPESALMPAEIAARMPEGFSVDDVADLLGRLRQRGEISQADPGTALLPGLGAMNADRLMERKRWEARQAAKRHSKALQHDTPVESRKATPAECHAKRTRKGAAKKRENARRFTRETVKTDVELFVDWAREEVRRVLGVDLRPRVGGLPNLKAALLELGDAEVRRRYAAYLRTDDPWIARQRPSLSAFASERVLNSGAVVGVNGHAKVSKTAAFLDRLGAGRGGPGDVIDVEVEK